MTNYNILRLFIIHDLHAKATFIYLKCIPELSLLSLVEYPDPVLPADFKFGGHFGFFSLLFPPQASSFHHVDVRVPIFGSSVCE